MKSWMTVLLGTLLTGCAFGIQSDGSSPSVSYTVPYNFQVVYMRAQHQARECQRGGSKVRVESKVDPATGSGVISSIEPITGAEVARTQFKANDARHTAVEQMVSGRGSWNQEALDAMEQSIRMDSSICFVYR